MQGQNPVLPDSPYVIVIGPDTFTTETVLIPKPEMSGVLVSGLNNTGIKLTLDVGQSDSTIQKTKYPNGDSLRIYTYLFRNEHYRISFPQRIDSVQVYEMISNESHVEVDTTDHVDINRFVKNLSRLELKKLIGTEIQVFKGTIKLKVDRIGIMLVWPDGFVHGTNYPYIRIQDNKRIKKILKKFPTNGHLIIDCIWFYDSPNDRRAIDGAIGWKII